MRNVEIMEFGVIVNEEQQFGVWPTHLKLPAGYRFAGPTGTQTEMQELVAQQFVETAPATYITPEEQFRASQWAD
jgi:MbtH protein